MSAHDRHVAQSPWNLNNLGVSSRSLLRHVPGTISGMTVSAARVCHHGGVRVDNVFSVVDSSMAEAGSPIEEASPWVVDACWWELLLCTHSSLLRPPTH